MISVIITINNRAHLLRWGLEGLIAQSWVKANQGNNLELIILDDGSTDFLDDLLAKVSVVIKEPVKKWTWDRSKHNIAFNCPAIPYNILVKLAKNEYIFKMDPEMVLLDEDFLTKAIEILNVQRNAIVMPFPYHCKEFNFRSLEEIKAKYMDYHYQTHITRENAKERMIYYMALFNKESFLSLGGIDERFSQGIGNEDDHFLKWWRKVYGTENFIPLLDSPAVHLYHGGMAESPDKGPIGVPPNLYEWVRRNEILALELENTKPNDGIEWGRVDENMKLITWKDGVKNINSEKTQPSRWGRMVKRYENSSDNS